MPVEIFVPPNCATFVDAFAGGLVVTVPDTGCVACQNVPDTGCVACQNAPVTATLAAMLTGCVACQNVPDTGNVAPVPG